MTSQHPITQPTELVNKLKQQWSALNVRTRIELAEYLVTNAYQIGADMELEACCEWLDDPELGVDVGKLRAARRPEPPSLKEQALKELDAWTRKRNGPGVSSRCEGLSVSTIRRALEQLDD